MTMKPSISPKEFESAYIKYACNEVSHNTMTRGEFSKKIETDRKFYKRFFNDYVENNQTEIK
jgi:hypothetical protein